jgi:hypothetical protein
MVTLISEFSGTKLTCFSFFVNRLKAKYKIDNKDPRIKVA